MRHSKSAMRFAGLLLSCGNLLACSSGGGPAATNPAPAGGQGGTAGSAGSAAGSSATAGGTVGNGGGTGGALNPAGGGPDSLGGVGGSSAGGASGVGGSSAGAGGSGGGMSTVGKVVLFDGSNFDAWAPLSNGGAVAWQLVGDGSMLVVPGSGNIVTKQKFDDIFLHIEYKTPTLPASVTGQERGNSGIYLHSSYEMQVLDSFGLPPEIDGCGAVYQVKAPLAVACFGEDTWNTYEIEFKAPRFDGQGKKLSNALFVNVTLNGVLVQMNTEAPDSTTSGQPEAPGPQPLMLQDHNNSDSFRNIWVIPR